MMQTSQLDDREYKILTLDNKLNVILIRDKDVSINCVTMLVKIGYMFDEYAGMAHFLEHMLFMGTEKFPNEKHFSEFILKNGGRSNAYTTSDHTCYYYTINGDKLEESIDIFSQFFISPLFKSESINRELTAVNSEHEKNIHNDEWRHEEIINRIVFQDHAYGKFGTGSFDTLKIPNIDKKVRQFYNNTYSSNKMTLMIMGNDRIDKLEQLAIKYFTDVKLKNNLQTPNDGKRIYGDVLQYPNTIKIVPLEDKEKLYMLWDMPYDEKSKHSLLFMSYIMGHEGLNTLQYVLTKQGLIMNSIVGISDNIGDRCIFKLMFKMTKIGMANSGKIIQMVYAYIDLIKNNLGIELHRIFDEYVKIANLDFEYREKEDPENTLLSLVHTIMFYNVSMSDAYSFRLKIKTFDELKTSFQHMLSLMIDERCILIKSTKVNANKSNLLQSPHYGTLYTTKAVYHKYDKHDCKRLMELLQLPNPNKYIATDFTLYQSNTSCGIPTKITNAQCDTYVLHDTSFKLPMVSVNVRIDIPLSTRDVLSHCKTVLYINGIMGMINHELYNCAVAGNLVDIELSDGALYLDIYGYSDKIVEVCDIVVSSLLSKHIDKITYESTLYQLKQSDINAKHRSPYIKVNDLLEKTMCVNFFTSEDRIKCINDVNKFDVINVPNDIFRLTSIKTMICGNITSKISEEIAQILCKFNTRYVYTPSIFDFMHVNHIMSSEGATIKPPDTTYEKNSAVMYCVELSRINVMYTPNWIKELCLISIIDNMIGDKYFDKLRTNEEFGYVVNGKVKQLGDASFGTYFYRYLVQSASKSTNEIIDRTNKFIFEFEPILNNLTDDDITDYVDGCMMPLTYPFTCIQEKCNYMFSQLEMNHLTFDINSKLVEMYKTICKDDIVQFYHEKFINNKKCVIVGYDSNK
jgi:insulysin